MEQLQEKIASWLENPERDYNEGIGLLSTVSKNKNLLRALSRSESKYNKEKLMHELSKFATADPPPPLTTTTHTEATHPVVEPKPDTVPNATENKDATPPVAVAGGVPDPPAATGSTTTPSPETLQAVEQLEQARAAMHNKKGILSNSLIGFADNDNEGRKACLNEINSLNNAMQEIGTKLAYFEKNGELPPLEVKQPVEVKENEIPDDPIQMKQMLLNERTNLSKIRAKLKNPETKTELLPDLEAKLASKTKLVDEIQRRLNG
jgi:hypothetical protein